MFLKKKSFNLFRKSAALALKNKAYVAVDNKNEDNETIDTVEEVVDEIEEQETDEKPVKKQKKQKIEIV